MNAGSPLLIVCSSAPTGTPNDHHDVRGRRTAGRARRRGTRRRVGTRGQQHHPAADRHSHQTRPLPHMNPRHGFRESTPVGASHRREAGSARARSVTGVTVELSSGSARCAAEFGEGINTRLRILTGAGAVQRSVNWNLLMGVTWRVGASAGMAPTQQTPGVVAAAMEAAQLRLVPVLLRARLHGARREADSGFSQTEENHGHRLGNDAHGLGAVAPAWRRRPVCRTSTCSCARAAQFFEFGNCRPTRPGCATRRLVGDGHSRHFQNRRQPAVYHRTDRAARSLTQSSWWASPSLTDRLGLRAERRYRIDADCAPRRKEAACERDSGEQSRRKDERQRIGGAHSDE